MSAMDKYALALKVDALAGNEAALDTLLLLERCKEQLRCAVSLHGSALALGADVAAVQFAISPKARA